MKKRSVRASKQANATGSLRKRKLEPRSYLSPMSTTRTVAWRYGFLNGSTRRSSDLKAICKSLETGKRYRVLAQKEIGATQLPISDVYNTHCCMEIWLFEREHTTLFRSKSDL